MADKKLKANLEIDGSLNLKVSPNGQGDFLTINNLGLIQKRTALQALQDLNIPNSIQVDSSIALNNVSDTHQNKAWFDYNWAGTGRVGSVINFSGLPNSGYSIELFGQFGYAGQDFFLRAKNGDLGYWNPVKRIWTDADFTGSNIDSWNNNLVIYQDNRVIKPIDVLPNKFRWGFGTWNNNGGFSHFADYLHLNSYPDGSPGKQNLLMFSKSGFGFRQYQEDWQSTNAYSNFVDYWHSGNFTQTDVNNWNNNMLLYEDRRIIKPSDIGTNRYRWGFTTYDNLGGYGNFADFLHFNTFADGSGGNQNLIMFSKNGFGIRQYQALLQDTNPYSNYVDYWNTGNFTQTNINSWNNAVNWINNYSLPMASSTVLGGIKIGSGLSIDANGIVTATGATQINSDWNATMGISQILNKPTSLSQFTNDSGFITSFTETDPTVPIHVKNITTTDINNWNDAYSWGNHALSGYLTSASLTGYATQTWVQSQGYLSLETSEWQNNSYDYSIANPLSLGSKGIDTKGGFASNTQVLLMDSIIVDDVHTVIRHNVSDDNIELEIPPAENFIDREIVITNNVTTSSSTSGLILLIGDPVRLNSNANIESVCSVAFAPFGAPFPNFWSSITIKSIKDNTANGASWYVIDKSR